MRTSHKAIVLTLSFGLLAACGGGGSEGGSGELSLRVTDAPVDSATSVTVEFTGIELRGASNQVFRFDSPRQIDLLALTGGDSELLLNGVTLPAGRYEQLRLLVNAGQDASDSYITLDDGSTHALYIPSGNQSGLKLTGGFTVPEDGRADFTIDFDLRKSVTNPQGLGGAYILKPTLRLVDTIRAGAIAGSVDATLASATGCAPAVYVYAGSDATPDDEGSAGAPLSSAAVSLDEASGEYGYHAAFLPAGDYTVAFTCGAAADDPEADDAISFVGAGNASVASGQTTTFDFAVGG